MDDRLEEGLVALFDDRPLICDEAGYTLSFETYPHEAEADIQALLKRLSEAFEIPFGAKIAITEQAQNDWVEQYRQSIQPQACGPFWVRPSWHLAAAEPWVDLVIDPGLVFGTGHHETTCACLEALGRLDLHDKSVLDVGCGSGILGIAAAKRGAKASLCDTDEAAIIETKKQAELNDTLLDELWVGSVDQTKRRYDVVVANIVSDVLIAISGPLKGALLEGGILIVSGVLPRYEARVQAAFAPLVLDDRLIRGEWLALVFKLEK